ncbi:Lysine histidine transporter 1 [Quillaja saponaria]|uniref:Lysine histidine transporter 1 n=1 Tax=Quillaja saponaria TaxID=32244 RepID=A0AAD7VGH8_QUISA|nr:Lysine histidine transporter 1 [Quillaja saponaria]
MWGGVVVACIVVALCYFPVTLIGYWMFGNSVKDNILISLNKPSWLIATANMFVVIHVIGSYQIYAMPVFDMIETVLNSLQITPSTAMGTYDQFSEVPLPDNKLHEDQNQKAIDDWLPITSSRNAKWWYSAFHNVTAMVGAGVLSLPYAMSNLGWYVKSYLAQT